MPATRIVKLTERPDLAETTGAWRWDAFFSDGDRSRADIIALEKTCAAGPGPLPMVMALLVQDRPAGMIALCLDDLPGRPELNPWLAGLYVDPPHRGHGHARLLINELETFARKLGITGLSLYTSTAPGLYARMGWRVIDQFASAGETFVIMQKQL
ncbi:GNAT family N-acetyltransferase [Camelimonas sp. ID_303_24]